MALRLDMRCTPMASTMVTTAGSPSGMAATAMATAVMNASMMLSGSRTACTMKMTAAMASTSMLKSFAVLPSCFWSGDVCCEPSVSMVAILPTSVLMPV